MQHCLQRLDSLDKQVEKLANSKPYKKVVGLLRCFHGIDTLSAITIITEIFDFGRFSSPDELMNYLGLTCSEFSSGEKQKRGSITRAGNKHIRRLLVEAAWHYRHPCNINKALRGQRCSQPQWAIDIADRAGQRLRKRYRHLTNCGKMSCKVTVAIAHELAGFIWSVFKEYNGPMMGLTIHTSIGLDSFEDVTDVEGHFDLKGLPNGKKISGSVYADGYEECFQTGG